MVPMGGRYFVAVRPPQETLDELERSVEPRREADARLAWVAPDQWHITTLFVADLEERSFDPLVQGLADLAARTSPFDVICGGPGTFPNPFQARLLYLDVPEGGREFAALSRTCRGIANHAGAEPDGSRFVPHLSLARTKAPFDVTKWMHVIQGFGNFPWQATELELIESHLGQGPGGTARHALVERFPLGAPMDDEPEASRPRRAY